MTTPPRPTTTPRRAGRTAAWSLLVLGLAGCSQGGLDPRGPEADRILGIFWALLVAAAVVSMAVVALWWWGTVRGRADDELDHRLEHVPDSRRGRWFVVGGGLVMPAVVMAVFFGVQIASTMAQTQPDPDGLTVEVVGHRYWWELTYRGVDGVEEAITTANEMHVPTGTDVTVVLRSEDVIHSFWVPELAGKVDLVPGRENQFVMSADEPGRYAGYCAEYCGLQHAWMKFEVVASPPEEFEVWARGHAEPAAEPDTELERRGREVFEGQSCVGCHTIRGVSEGADLGPELTHLASRDEIGAGILPLTEEDLRAWVANAQAIKPGAQMPPQELTTDELDALVAYLMSLE